MTTTRDIVARNLRGLRKARSFSQDQLAAEAGIDRTYISDLENAKYGASIDVLALLATALSAAPWELLHPDTYKNLRDRTRPAP